MLGLNEDAIEFLVELERTEDNVPWLEDKSMDRQMWRAVRLFVLGTRRDLTCPCGRNLDNLTGFSNHFCWSHQRTHKYATPEARLSWKTWYEQGEQCSQHLIDAVGAAPLNVDC